MKRNVAAALCFLYLLGSGVAAADIFGARPRRDRQKESPRRMIAEKRSSDSDAPLYEKIFESYLKEDYAAAERLALDYAAGEGSSSQKEDILNLRALSLLKLGREAEGLEALRRLEGPASPVLGMGAVEETPLFSVQVGSFSKKENAQNLLRKLAGKGYDAYLVEGPSGTWRVRVGRFASKEEAEEAKARLDQDGTPTKIVP
ncbi:MAG: SPOR domain-containing protein [Candidatus Omnitrophica bacterium]|nr:SPOR domain-containing protein [Candidatus Omnitrophota bacterium]